MRLISCVIVIAGLLFIAVAVAQCASDLQEKLNGRVAGQLDKSEPGGGDEPD